VFMDRGLPDMSGLDATRLVLSSCPEISVSGLSIHEEEDMAASMIKAGAVVYLTKRGATCPLISTIRASATASTSKAIIRQNNAGRTLAAVQLQAAAQQELRNFVIQVY
jgi:DNA-binding NarL/FixJ family response regulator